MIGAKNRRIGIWQHDGSMNEANEPNPDGWVEVKQRWAHVRGETGLGSIRAAAAAGGINTPLDRYSFRINYDRSITVEMQVRYPDGSRFNILGVRHDLADREWTDIVCETGGADG